MKNPENVRNSLSSYIKQLREFLKEADTSRPVQGAVLYITDYTIITDDKDILANSDQLLLSVRRNIPSDQPSVTVYSKSYGDFIEYIRYDTDSEHQECVLYVRVKTEKNDRLFRKRHQDIWTPLWTPIPQDDIFAYENIVTLFNAIVQEYLHLHSLSATSNSLLSPHEKNALLIAAGQKFTGRVLQDYISGNWQDLIINLNIVSSLAYESQTNRGNMVLMKKEIWDMPIQPDSGTYVHLDIRFKEPVRLTEYKRMRKLYEIATADTCLASDGVQVYGITRESYLAVLKYAKVCICGPLKWELYEPNVKAENGSPRIVHDRTIFKLKKKKPYRRQLTTCLKNICKAKTNTHESDICKRCDYAKECTPFQINNEQQKQMIDAMVKIIEAATKQLHGTTIVFSLHAKQEVARLSKTCFLLNREKKLDDEVLVKQITAIDGAVLCDFNGFCHGIGVILDGKTIGGESDETIDRGARYNSAIRYKNAFPCTIICIISEDGDVNII